MKLNKKNIRKRIDKNYMIYGSSYRQVRKWLRECEKEGQEILSDLKGKHYDDEYEDKEEERRITKKAINNLRYWMYAVEVSCRLDEKYLKKRREF